MILTVKKILETPSIIDAIIDRVQQTKLDKIYWQEYGTFKETRDRVFKSYLGTVTGVTAGTIIAKNDENPIRSRRTLGSGYLEVACMGDAYQMDNDRIDDLNELVKKLNGTVQPADSQAIMREIVDFIVDDFRQCVLAPHKRMDLVVGSMLMTGMAKVNSYDKEDGARLLDITLPFNTITPTNDEVFSNNKLMFVTYLKKKLNELKAKYGVYPKMIMTEKTFSDFITGSTEFLDKYKMILAGGRYSLQAGLITSEVATQIFRGIGLPDIEIKDDYVEKQNSVNEQVYADGYITLLPSAGNDLLYMRHHTPACMADPELGRNFRSADGQNAISSYRDHEGRYTTYNAEWIPEVKSPQKITNFNLKNINLG